MIKVDITNDQYKRARDLYKFGSLNYSITSGAGNIVGALGEIIVHDTWSQYLEFPRESSPNYDLITSNGLRIDVKSKRISSNAVVYDDFKVSVTHKGLGITQDCDWYVFCFISDDYYSGYILGWYNKHKFLKDSIFKRKGELDDIGRVLNKGWRFPADVNLMLVKDLIVKTSETM